jgi:hypothetical protein
LPTRRTGRAKVMCPDLGNLHYVGP